MELDASGDWMHRTAVVITSELELIGSYAEAAGYDVVGASDNSVNGARLTALHRPDLVVVEHASTGEHGWNVVPRLRLASPASRLLFVVEDEWADPGSVGAVAVIARPNLQRLAKVPGDLRAWIETQIDAPIVSRQFADDRRDLRGSATV